LTGDFENVQKAALLGGLSVLYQLCKKSTGGSTASFWFGNVRASRQHSRRL
jgi:hypothetical protein